MAAARLLGAKQVVRIDEPTMTTEDFGCLIETAGAGCYYHIGAGSPYPLHSAQFLPPPQTVPRAAAVHAAVLHGYLERTLNNISR